MKRKGRSQVITIVSLIIAFIALSIAYFFDEATKLVTITANITAVVGVFAVYIQIRKSKIVEQSSFTIEISKYFYEVPGISDLIHKIGRASVVDDSEYVIKTEDRQTLIKYLNYLKTVATLVEDKVIDIYTLNNVFAYEFFIVLNNKSVQKLELGPFAKFYTDIFELYFKWSKYREKKGFENVHNKNLLSDMKEYKDYIEKEMAVWKRKKQL